jgi:hypothetical protein
MTTKDWKRKVRDAFEILKENLNPEAMVDVGLEEYELQLLNPGGHFFEPSLDIPEYCEHCGCIRTDHMGD